MSLLHFSTQSNAYFKSFKYAAMFFWWDLNPGLLFLRRMRCPLHHAARASYHFFIMLHICTYVTVKLFYSSRTGGVAQWHRTRLRNQRSSFLGCSWASPGCTFVLGTTSLCRTPECRLSECRPPECQPPECQLPECRML
jgi:hypothetical protein